MALWMFQSTKATVQMSVIILTPSLNCLQLESPLRKTAKIISEIDDKKSRYLAA